MDLGCEHSRSVREPEHGFSKDSTLSRNKEGTIYNAILMVGSMDVMRSWLYHGDVDGGHDYEFSNVKCIFVYMQPVLDYKKLF